MTEQQQTVPFEWNAQAYHTQSNPQFELAVALLDEVVLEGNEVVIDAGCGTGRVTEEILHRVPGGRVIAVDASEAMVEMAREVLLPNHADKVQVILADLEKFCVPDEANLIFSSSTLHFVEDTRLVLQNFAQMLRPGGRVALLFGTPSFLQRPPFSLEAKLKEDPKLMPYLAGWLPRYVGVDPVATRYFLQEAGFGNICVRVEEGHLDFTQQMQQVEENIASGMFMTDVMDRFQSEELSQYFVQKLQALWPDAGKVAFEYAVVHAQMPEMV